VSLSEILCKCICWLTPFVFKYFKPIQSSYICSFVNIYIFIIIHFCHYFKSMFPSYISPRTDHSVCYLHSNKAGLRCTAFSVSWYRPPDGHSGLCSHLKHKPSDFNSIFTIWQKNILFWSYYVTAQWMVTAWSVQMVTLASCCKRVIACIYSSSYYKPRK